jgi:hypothetical protein
VCVCCGASQIHALGREEKRKKSRETILPGGGGGRGYLYIIRVYKWFPLFSFIRRCFCLLFLKEKKQKKKKKKEEGRK